MIKKIILWSMTLIWAFTIFMFSAQPASESDVTSVTVAEKIIKFAEKINLIDIPVSSDGREVTIKKIAKEINVFVRKIAHFSAYMLLGILVFMLSTCYFNNKKSIILTLLICLLYAISDEIHQIFVPGRAGRWYDVMIDFLGSLTGAVLSVLFLRIKFIVKNRPKVWDLRSVIIILLRFPFPFL